MRWRMEISNKRVLMHRLKMWTTRAQIPSEDSLRTLLQLSQWGDTILTNSCPLLMSLDASRGIKFLLFPGNPSLKLRKTPTPLEKSLEKEAGRVFKMGSWYIIGALSSGATDSLESGQRQTDKPASASSVAHFHTVYFLKIPKIWSASHFYFLIADQSITD